MMTIREKIIRLKNAFLYKIVTRFPYNKVRVLGLRKLGFEIGEEVYYSSSCVITQNFVYNRGKLVLGDRVAVGPNVMFILISHPNHSKIRAMMMKDGDNSIIVGSDVWIGGGSIILPGIKIGEGAVIGAGAVVTKNVEAYTIVAGNPAKVLRKLPIP